MPNPNQPKYGRLQIDTPDVDPTSSRSETAVRRDNVGGAQSAGFKFAADSSSAYNTPDTLLGAVTRNAAGVAKAASDMMDVSKKWSLDSDKVTRDDMEAEAARIQTTELYQSGDETTRANLMNDHYAVYDDLFITDDFKRQQKVRRYQSNAAIDIARGVDTTTAFARAMRDAEDLPAAERIELLEQYKESASDIIDPRMRDQFDISIRAANAGIVADWRDKNVEAVKGFNTWLGVHFQTKEQITAVGIDTRDAFMEAQTGAYMDTFQGLDDQQRATMQHMLESIAGDQYDRAQLATGRAMSFEKSQLVASGVLARDNDMVMPVLREQSAMKGLSVLTQAMATGQWDKGDDPKGYATGVARELFGDNPAIMHDFLRQIPALPEGIDPRFNALHAAAQQGSDVYNDALEQVDEDTLDVVFEMYGARAASAIKGTETADGGKVGGAAPTPAQEQLAATNAMWSGAEAEIRAEFDIPADQPVDRTLVQARILEQRDLPGAGLSISTTSNFTRETIPSLMNATASLPPGPVREANERSLSSADDAVGRWFARMVEKDQIPALEQAGLMPVYRTYLADRVLKNLPGQTPEAVAASTLAPGTLASMIEDLPDNAFTKELRAAIVGTMEGRHKALLKSEYYDEATGFRRTISHDDAGTFATDYSSRTYSDLAGAKQNNYYKATSAAFAAAKSGDPLFTNTDAGYELNVDSLNANDQLKYIIPSLSMQTESNPNHPGLRALTDEMIDAVYPSHISELYKNGSPSLRMAIRTMTTSFFQQAQDLSDAAPFVSSFEDRLDDLMATSADPATRARGLERIGAVRGLAAGVVTVDSIRSLGGRGTMQETATGHGWLSSGPTDFGKRNFSDENYFKMLDKRFPDLKGQPEEQEQAYARQIDEQVSGQMVQFALDDPDFRDVLMTELAGNPAPSEEVLAAALAQWKSENDIVVTLLPNNAAVDPNVLDTGPFSSVNEGQLFTEMATNTNTGLKFTISRLPKSGDIGSMSLVDGSSQYSDVLDANSGELYLSWRGDGVEEATGFTNAASRSFLNEGDIATLNDNFASEMAKHLGVRPTDILSDPALSILLSGSPMSSPHVATPGTLGVDVNPAELGDNNSWRYMHSLGIDPTLPQEERAKFRQYSAERAFAVMAVAAGVSSGQININSTTDLANALETYLPSNEDDSKEIRRSLMRLVERRGFDTYIDVQTRTGDRLKIEDPALITRMKRLAGSGSAQPVPFRP